MPAPPSRLFRATLESALSRLGESAPQAARPLQRQSTGPNALSGDNVLARRPPPKPKYTPYVDSRLSPDQGYIVSLLKQGVTRKDIADEMLTSPEVIRQQLFRVRNRAPDLEGMTSKPGRPRKHDAAELYALREALIADGTTARHGANEFVAKRLGLSSATVRNQISQYLRRRSTP